MIRQTIDATIPGVPSRDGRPRCASACQRFRRRHRPRIVQIESGTRSVKSQSNSGWAKLIASPRPSRAAVARVVVSSSHSDESQLRATDCHGNRPSFP